MSACASLETAFAQIPTSNAYGCASRISTYTYAYIYHSNTKTTKKFDESVLTHTPEVPESISGVESRKNQIHWNHIRMPQGSFLTVSVPLVGY